MSWIKEVSQLYSCCFVFEGQQNESDVCGIKNESSSKSMLSCTPTV